MTFWRLFENWCQVSMTTCPSILSESMLSKLTSQSLGLGKAQHIERLFNRFYTYVRTTSFSPDKSVNNHLNKQHQYQFILSGFPKLMYNLFSKNRDKTKINFDVEL